MAVNHKLVHRPLDSRSLGFFEEVPMIVTSSPIERKIIDIPAVKEQVLQNNLTWCAVLKDYYSTQEQTTLSSSLSKDSSRGTSTNTESSSNYQPIIEHRLKVEVGDKKMKLLSQRKKVFPEKEELFNGKVLLTQEHCNQNQENLNKICEKLRKKNVTVDEVLKFEEFLKQTTFFGKKCTKNENSDTVGFIEKELGNLNVTPRTLKLLQKKKKDQEKRVLELMYTKKGAIIESKQTLATQLKGTEEKIKRREELELKQIRAERLRQKAIASATVFSSIHSAHQKAVAKKAQQRQRISELEKQMQSELVRVQSQTNQMVKNIFTSLQKEQCTELREQMRSQKQNDKELIKLSEVKLGQLKSSYEERLRELKEVVSSKAAESKEEHQEITREISRINKGLQRQFDQNFNALLEKIAIKGKNDRELREKKGSELVDKILKADYVFDL